jgi:hypothetical protein
MPILDFKEIPLASKGPGRDQFELFARDLLELRPKRDRFIYRRLNSRNRSRALAGRFAPWCA